MQYIFCNCYFQANVTTKLVAKLETKFDANGGFIEHHTDMMYCFTR